MAAVLLKQKPRNHDEYIKRDSRKWRHQLGRSNPFVCDYLPGQFVFIVNCRAFSVKNVVYIFALIALVIVFGILNGINKEHKK